MTPVFQSVGGNPVTTSEIARPFMVGANYLYPIFVEFANADSQTVDRLSKIHEKLILESKQISNMLMPFEQAKNQLQAKPEYETFREELLENFYWKAADYQVVLSISHDDKRAEIYRYHFLLTQDEASEFKQNIDAAMLCELHLFYYQPANFKTIQKDFNPLEG